MKPLTMNNEISIITAQLKDAFEGDPWFGRSANSLLSEITEDIAFEKPNGQHSIVDLIWHMINWKEFTINSLDPANAKNVHLFEENDWRALDHSDRSLLQKGLEQLKLAQKQLVDLLAKQQDSLLENIVPGRDYTYRKLLYGIVQHDIYHLGQIAYVKKLLAKE